MRFLKRNSLIFRNARSNKLAVSAFGEISMDTTRSVRVPKGETQERPTRPENGQIRYNTSTNQLEAYAQNSWRSIRFKESGNITQQTLGIGDASETIFGPLTPTPPSISQSGSTWGGQNLIVLVENVFQLFNTNYLVLQNPPGRDPGYYLEFLGPVPYGKPVTVLHGFDQ